MRFLFVDRILHLDPGQRIQGLKHVSADDFYLTSDENGRRYFPTSLIGEALGQLAAWAVMHDNHFSFRPVAGIVSKASFSRSVYPGETLFLDSVIDTLDDESVVYHGQGFVGDEEVFNIESALGPMLPMATLIAADDAKRQFEEIFRPGDFNATSLSGKERLFQELPPSVQFSYDYLLDIEPGVSVKAIKRITRLAPWFPDHFPNKPVLPLTVLLECKMNLAKAFLRRSEFGQLTYSPVEISRIKMNEFILPGDEVVSQLKVKHQSDEDLVLSCRSEVNGKRVCVLEIRLARRER